MKKIISTLILVILASSFIFGQNQIISTEAYASYYGEAFNGKPTANGEIFDMTAYTAAHKTLPFGTLVEVTNLENGKKVIVRINDRGPFVGNREIDVSKAAAKALDMLAYGVVRVSLRTVNPNDMNSYSEMKNNEEKTSNMTVAVQKDEYEINSQPQRTVIYNTPNEKTKNLVYTPTTSEETPGELWRIQLGSFKREENAMRLVIQLRKIGFEPAYEKAESTTRVVLYGIRPQDLEKVKRVLELNALKDYILRQESW